MNTFLAAVGYLSIAAVGVSVYRMVMTLSRERRLRPRDLGLAAAFSVALLVVFVAVLDVEAAGTSWLLLAAGAVAGIAVVRTAEMRAVGGEVLVKRSHWFLVVWAVGFAYAQLALLGLAPGGPASGLGAMFFATGATLGSSVTMLYRRGRELGTGAGTCPHCGTSTHAGAPRCHGCGWRIVFAAPSGEPQA
jgi:hypothetical protein